MDNRPCISFCPSITYFSAATDLLCSLVREGSDFSPSAAEKASSRLVFGLLRFRWIKSRTKPRNLTQLLNVS